ncbi:MAG: xanthine dehydrogenase family protein molybdopterin-binding subunit [Scytonema hyalinum WJT4-NPBG1]|jgi:xanthine dehydrogenase YagR molybdenum-binding subunit|nr:xanthine dehydrogenase family protein molybdopterin-binding subunit [Scytonema hyalinum WJT4-NPBG1]
MSEKDRTTNGRGGMSEVVSATVGAPVDRVDGRLKVTGSATYAAEPKIENLAYAVLVQSAIANGRIRDIDTRDAERAPGVLAVVTHRNAPQLKELGQRVEGAFSEEKLLPLQSDRVHYAGQHVAVVVAETLEQAEHAATLVGVAYDEQQPAVELSREMPRAYQPQKFFGTEDLQIRRGRAGEAFAAAEVKVDQTYTTQIEHHNPMEPHATIAVWEGDRLTLYDPTQWPIGARNMVAAILGLAQDRVRVVSPFVGGGFGCKAFVWAHTILTAVTARQIKRPVKLVLRRQQMFTSVGHRARTVHQLSLGASRDGKLSSVRQVATTHTSQVGEFLEPCGLSTRLLYAVPNLEITYNGVRLNLGTPMALRGTEGSTDCFVLECAMDELAYELGIDPIDLRLRNHAEVNPHTNKPWSSKHLKECYRIGAERFGWSRRNPQPRAMRDGHYLIGYGMATSTFPGVRSPATVRARIMADGSAIMQSATHDMGVGTYTIMAQIAADTLGLPVERVRVELGDSRLPHAPVGGGARTVASVGPAVKAACKMARGQIVRAALADSQSPLSGRREEEIAFGQGRLFLRDEPSRGEAYADVLRRAQLPMVESCATTPLATTTPPVNEEAVTEESNTTAGGSPEGRSGAAGSACVTVRADPDVDMNQDRYAFQSFGAQFCEVGVDEDLGTVRVRRFTNVFDIGRVINEKTARSQAHGGVVWGIGMALTEETVYDNRNGRPVVRSLADYHVPVNADVPDIDVQFLGIPDPHINSFGARGIGELSMNGVAAAIANAIYHATGKRIRDLPITPDKLL